MLPGNCFRGNSASRNRRRRARPLNACHRLYHVILSMMSKGRIPRHRHRHRRRHPRDDSREDVGDDVGVGVVECGLNQTALAGAHTSGTPHRNRHSVVTGNQQVHRPRFSPYSAGPVLQTSRVHLLTPMDRATLTHAQSHARRV